MSWCWASFRRGLKFAYLLQNTQILFCIGGDKYRLSVITPCILQVMRISIHCNQINTGTSDMGCCNWNFGIGQKPEARVHVVESSWFCLQYSKVSLFFSVVRAHLAEQHDPCGHTRPIGRRLSMAGLGDRLPILLVSRILDFWTPNFQAIAISTFVVR